MISFDMGGQWRPLSAPVKDADGKLIECEVPPARPPARMHARKRSRVRARAL